MHALNARVWLCLALLAPGSPLLAAPTETSLDPETGLATWQTESAGIQVRLTQIDPNQIRAFYQARGFSPQQLEPYAATCVFMTVVRNIGTTAIEHRLADWHYQDTPRQSRHIRSKEEWDALWTKMEVPQPARIAFTWAQFPAEQRFEPGDWNQGMTSYDLPRTARFDLTFTWQQSGDTRTGQLNNVGCANESR